MGTRLCFEKRKTPPWPRRYGTSHSNSPDGIPTNNLNADPFATPTPCKRKEMFLLYSTLISQQTSILDPPRKVARIQSPEQDPLHTVIQTVAEDVTSRVWDIVGKRMANQYGTGYKQSLRTPCMLPLN